MIAHVAIAAPTGSRKTPLCSKHIDANAAVEKLYQCSILTMDNTFESLINVMESAAGTKGAGLQMGIFDELALLFGMIGQTATGSYSIDKARFLSWYVLISCVYS